MPRGDAGVCLFGLDGLLGRVILVDSALFFLLKQLLVTFFVRHHPLPPSLSQRLPCDTAVRFEVTLSCLVYDLVR